MSITTLIHNLKLLGFDESEHGKGAIKLDEKIFTHGAINNDKALEYICLFLFRKVDKLRVNKELLPTLTVRTSAGRQRFVAYVYKWLVEIRQKTHILDSVPLRKSEFSTCQGANLIKIMLAFSTYVLQKITNRTGAGEISTMSKAAIQNNIVQSNQVFNASRGTSSTYSDRATKAAKEISAELSALPPPPPPPFGNATPVESQWSSRLNGHLHSLIHNLHTIESDAASEEPSITLASSEQSTSVQRSSSSLSFESLRVLEELSTSSIAGQPRIVKPPSSPTISQYSEQVSEPSSSPANHQYSEQVNETPTTVFIKQPSIVEASYIPASPDYADTINASSSTLSAAQPPSMEASANSVYVKEPNTVVTASDFSLFNAAASSASAEGPALNTATIRPSSPELDSAETEVPNMNSSKPKRTLLDVYIPEGSRMISTPNYISRSFTPEDEQRDVPDASRSRITQPKPRARTPDTNYTQRNTNPTQRNTSFPPRNALYCHSAPSLLPPMQLNYTTKPLQLPPLRHMMLKHSDITSPYSPYWSLPPISQKTTNPSLESVSPSSPPSAPKRRYDEQEDQDSIVVPLSPLRQRRRLSYVGYEGGATPTSYDMELVPPLMDESAPFKRIYNTKFFDIDLMTPRR